MKELFDSAQILINVAERAQAKGILSLDEAVSVKQSIDIQTNYYKSLADQLKEQETPIAPEEKPVKKTPAQRKAEKEAQK